MNYSSRIIHIGRLQLGNDQPIRLQSMTSTNTLDTNATVEQAIRMIDAGCEMVRITAPGLKEAAHLQLIKEELKKRGISVPLIADIHFNPGAAEIAARIVEKVRINPGNYIDKKSGRIDYTEAEYNEELERIAGRLLPLLKICKQHGTAIRIGTNHGSLSQRIVSRYGDTPEGMVQSALEFTRICSNYGFHNLVLSMKSSNVRVMVNAYRMLAKKLTAEGLNYPLHLGVTEAGDGEDGRLKSIAGIGALLARGIGDTIRVSLTEDPEFELPVAKSIVERFHKTSDNNQVIRYIRPDLSINREIKQEKIASVATGNIGGKNPPAVLLKRGNAYFIADEKGGTNSVTLPFLEVDSKNIDQDLTDIVAKLRSDANVVLLSTAGSSSIRKLINKMHVSGLKNPLILKSAISKKGIDDFIVENSLNPGNLLLDGLGDGICVETNGIAEEEAIRIGFGLLQATRMRVSRTEFIACPSCGRTLFNIQEALQQVKARTSHLNGLKIAVMGCIVNGPGEMADADYGYVGAGNGKVTLYKGKEPVRRGIAETDAVDVLIELIKENGDWKENG
ncbi:MAG: 4-hydroxy-3-methylbut-2-en-1-yl diphosphate synthase [Bacteroidetes bacterium HGW-Bacteroidetes-9]|nr:MAG: 4-hydroxy-3-methylbut-2-en-1-yl diphosphate synthase [Bacteroidetes bacterium HGW-Bacteroidetes-9]